MASGIKKMKRYAFIFSVLMFCSLTTFSQLTIKTVDQGPYTPGSTIAATFSSVGVQFKADNKFELYISDENGGFASATPIGRFEELYSTFVNGIIPATAIPSSNYKLQVRSTNPVLSSESAIFEIKTGAAVNAEVSSFPILKNTANQVVFGYCMGRDNSEFQLQNTSTGTATVTGTITNELTNTVESTLNFSSSAIQFNARLAHYTLFVKATMPDGTVSTRAYMIVNNSSATSFTNNGPGIVCLPGGTLEYSVDRNAMRNNFPGNTYEVLWGDGKQDIYTIFDLSIPMALISHEYLETSCGTPPYTVNGVTTYNVFGINISAQSPYCSGVIGRAINTTAKVVTKPKNDFTSPQYGCSKSEITFTNTSTPGQNPTGNSVDCEDNDIRYNWYVDGILIKSGLLLTDVFKYTFEKGTYTVTLTSVSSGYCEGDPISKTICVQDKPEPKFTILKNSNCGEFTFTPIDQSIIDNSCTPTTYTWYIPGNPAGTSVLNPNSTTPTFNIKYPGLYTIRLQLTNATTCGDDHYDREIVVNSFQQPTLSNDVTLCTPGRFAFNKSSGPTKTAYSGTIEGLDDTFKWVVAGGDFEFGSSTSDTSRYPIIIFKEFKTYTVTVTATTICGAKSDSQEITFTQSPVPKITAAKSAICHNAKIDLTGTIDHSTLSTIPKWVGDGVFSSTTDLSTQYTPTADEQKKGLATIRLELATGLSGSCATVFDEITITIYPENNHANTTAIICSEATLNYTPTSAIAGSTFTWTSAADATISGASAGTGPIMDKLINTSQAVAGKVVYTITATFDGCTGMAFTHTVTVNPIPVLAVTTGDLKICSTEKVTISFSASTPDTKFSWTAVLVKGTATGFKNLATPTSITAINDVLVNNSSADAVVRYTITPIAAGCTGIPQNVEITVAPGVTEAAAGPDQVLCSQTTTQLAANTPTVGTGNWSGIGVTFDNASKYNAQVSGLIPGQSYTLTWTITGNNGCDSKDVVEIKNLAALTNIIHATSNTFCSGQSATINGDVPTGGDGTYKYTWESSVDGVSWSAITGKNTQNLTFTVAATVQIRRTVTSSACMISSNVVILTVLPPIGNNVLTGSSAVCAGTTPALITGSVPTGGDGATYSYAWEMSIDGGTIFSLISGATDKDYQPVVATQTTSYRRLVSSGICTGAQSNISNPVTIGLSAPAIAEFTFTKDISCSAFIIDASNVKAVPHPAGNGTYEWFVDNVSIGTGINFPGITIADAGKTVEIKLVVISSLGCAQDTYSHSFSTYETFTAAYTQDKTEDCGPFAVQFTNTSSSLTVAAFHWDFGNGTTSNDAVPPPITFLPNIKDGFDKTYTITLTATSPCGVQTLTSTVLVKANAYAGFSPDKTLGCSPFPVNFTNTSLGGNLSYTYDFGDGSPIVATTSQADISHLYTVTEVTDFTVKMTASNECSTDAVSYIIRVSPNTIRPELVVNGNTLTGCAPFTVSFSNNTEGASSYSYDFGDGAIINTNKSPEVVQHTFINPGVYTVTLFATNGCSSASTTETITVLEQPITDFTASKTIGCSGMLVQFKNLSVNGVSYLWDFGDGTTSIEFEPTHIFTGPGKNFTVILTTVNSLGCPTTVTKSELIKVVTNPVSEFTVLPGNQIKYPNFTFDFNDISTEGVVRWEWDFGDKVTSTLQNPSHTYRELGSYAVQLTVTNKEGCTSQSIQVVAVLGVPNLLTVPNAFMPGSQKAELRTFLAKGKGIAEWRMTVFNKWGQVLWETTQLQDDAPIDGWDGTFKGQPQPQGTYFWKIDVTFINGSKWKGVSYNGSPAKTTGVIYLMR